MKNGWTKCIIFFACMLLFSCEKRSFSEELPAGDLLEFASQGFTKAAEQTSASVAEFGVFTYYDVDGTFDILTSTPSYMNNQQVKKQPSGWVYSPVRYWPVNGSLSFFAYSPYTSAVGSGNLQIDATNIPKYTYTNPNDYAAQADLLLSRPLIDETKAGLTGDKKTLIPFQHSLSCVMFNASVARKDANKVSVDKIELCGLYNKATCSYVPPTPPSGEYALEWMLEPDAVLEDYTLSVDNGALKDIDIKKIVYGTSPKTSISTDVGYLMLIPQQLLPDVLLKITVTFGSPARTLVMVKKLSTVIPEFEINKKYALEICVNVGDIRLECTVSDWKDKTVTVPDFN